MAVDTALDGAALAFSADAERCLPTDVEAPADGTLEWTETLNLRGTAKKPKWKSVALGLNEAETETWVWPFRARVEDATAEGVIVSLQASEGAVGPRASDITVKVPARERLSGSGSLASSDAGTEMLVVSVHPFGVPSRPLAPESAAGHAPATAGGGGAVAAGAGSARAGCGVGPAGRGGFAGASRDRGQGSTQKH